MGAVIGDILPLALGIAISPIPIIAAILMLLSPKARVTGVGFLLGWVVGIALAVTAFTLLSTVIPTDDPDTAQPVKAVVQLTLGALLLMLATRNWRSRPKPGEESALPKWMLAIDTLGFPMALGLGFLLSALNPKNLLMAAGAGVTVGAASLDSGETALALVIFTVLAASTVLVPVVGFLVAADKLRAPLDTLRDWLQKESAVIMAVLLLVLGVSMIGKGIGSF